MNEFIRLTSSNGSDYVININHIVGYYSVIGGDDVTVIETDSNFEDGRFLVKESVSFIFDTINMIRQGGIT